MPFLWAAQSPETRYRTTVAARHNLALTATIIRSYGTATAVISGVAWALWHWPAVSYGDYNAGTRAWYAVMCGTILAISISFVMAWLRLKSGSLWTGAILHASHNLYVQSIFTPLTRNTGKTAWYIDEFGVVPPLIAACFAIYFWSRRRELASGPRDRWNRYRGLEVFTRTPSVPASPRILSLADLSPSGLLGLHADDRFLCRNTSPCVRAAPQSSGSGGCWKQMWENE